MAPCGLPPLQRKPASVSAAAKDLPEGALPHDGLASNCLKKQAISLTTHGRQSNMRPKIVKSKLLSEHGDMWLKMSARRRAFSSRFNFPVLPKTVLFRYSPSACIHSCPERRDRHGTPARESTRCGTWLFLDCRTGIWGKCLGKHGAYRCLTRSGLVLCLPVLAGKLNLDDRGLSNGRLF